MRARWTPVILALVVAACGYVRSGRWTDAPENWSRAFGSSKPSSAEVLHSYYWRAPHFTYEAGYFFAVRDLGGFRAELFSRNKLRPVPENERAGAREGLLWHYSSVVRSETG
jgi:hypothetical protein